MKTGKTLVELATEIDRQRNSKRDYVAAVPALRMDNDAHLCFPAPGGDTQVLGMRDLAHRQVGEYARIPVPYYDRMVTEAPDLLAKNVNHWFAAQGAAQDRRMVRTLDGHVRAFLSDGYRPLDNADLAEAVFPALAELNLEILSTEITERRLYIKAVDPRIVRQVDNRRVIDGQLVTYDDVSPAITISNSEVGSGACAVDVSMYTHGCKNMMIFRESSLRKYHLGRKHELTEGLTVLLSEKTRALTDAALWAQVGDVVRGAFDQTRFARQVELVQDLTAQRIEGDVPKVVEVFARKVGMGEEEKSSVLKHLIAGGALTRYGLLNAVTRTAEDLTSYDRATEFERIGGQVLDLPANDWRAIAEAA